MFFTIIKSGSLRSPPAARLRALASLASSPAARALLGVVAVHCGAMSERVEVRQPQLAAAWNTSENGARPPGSRGIPATSTSCASKAWSSAEILECLVEEWREILGGKRLEVGHRDATLPRTLSFVRARPNGAGSRPRT
jgi:hypothetical protein